MASERNKIKLSDEDVSERDENDQLLLNAGDILIKMSPESGLLGLEEVIGLNLTGMGFRKCGRRKERKSFPNEICYRWRQKHGVLAWEGSVVKQKFVFCFLNVENSVFHVDGNELIKKEKN